MHLTEGLRPLEELELENKRALVRLDLNFPLDSEGQPTAASSLTGSLETLRLIMSKGARVIALAHRGPAEGKRVERLSLESIGAKLSELGGWDVFLPDDCVSDAAKKVIGDLRDGQLCLLENLRFQPGEAHNDEAFARQLAAYGDVYVNDALRASRHAHTSVVGLPRLMRQRGMGLTLGRELKAIDELVSGPERTLGAVISGQHLNERIELIEYWLPRCKVMCLAGPIASTLLRARGFGVGTTAVESEWLARGRTLLEKARDLGVELLLPTDLTWTGHRDAGPEIRRCETPPLTGVIADVGSETLANFVNAVLPCRAVLVVGALDSLARRTGLLERASTRSLLDGIAEKRADRVLVEDSEDASDDISSEALSGRIFQARGGTASLSLSSGKSLPGIEALRSPSETSP